MKGVAGRLQTTQARVREHLRILKLPAELQGEVASGEIPVRAVKPLGQLAGIHPGLAIAAVEQVRNLGEAYEPYTWADIERAPLDVALASGQLPEGVYRPHTPYSIDAFALGDSARKDLAAIERMLGRPIEHVQFDANDIAQARVLGAAHGDNWQAVIVGDDVASQLVLDYLARGVKEVRKRAREERKLEREAEASASSPANGSAMDRATAVARSETQLAWTGVWTRIRFRRSKRADGSTTRATRRTSTPGSSAGASLARRRCRTT